MFACNVLALLARCVEAAHQHQEPPPEVSTYHLAQQVKGSYEGMLVAVPPEHWPPPHEVSPDRLARRLLSLARHINPRQVATSKCKPKSKTPKGYVDGRTARSHVATERLITQTRIDP